MTNRIKKTFENLQLNDKKGIILYLTTGIPNNETTAELALELFNSGADIIELGIPFSDPLADGVTIQQSSQKALEKGVNIDTCFDVCKMIRNKNDNNPIVLMGYFNPILQYGLDEFISKAKSCGVDGIIVPDLPLEESLILLEKCSSNDINLIYLIAPTTSTERIKEICKGNDAPQARQMGKGENGAPQARQREKGGNGAPQARPEGKMKKMARRRRARAKNEENCAPQARQGKKMKKWRAACAPQKANCEKFRSVMYF